MEPSANALPTPNLEYLLARMNALENRQLLREVLTTELRGRLPRWFPRWLIPIVLGSLLGEGLNTALLQVMTKVAAEDAGARIPPLPDLPTPQ